MKRLFLALIILSFATTSNSQITKGNWLLGGSIKFSSITVSNFLGKNISINTEINGNAGYFFMDKIVAGLKPDISLATYRYSSTSKSSNLSIGPFIRYYLLPVDQTVNLFVEGDYALGAEKVSHQSAIFSNSFSFFCGPVFFLNSAVGVELLMGYTHSTSNTGAKNKASIIQAGIGFQFHLEKEK